MKQLIIDLFEKGLDPKDIADRLGINIETINKIIDQYIEKEIDMSEFDIGLEIGNQDPFGYGN